MMDRAHRAPPCPTVPGHGPQTVPQGEPPPLGGEPTGHGCSNGLGAISTGHGQLTLFSGPSSPERRGPSEGGEVTGGAARCRNLKCYAHDGELCAIGEMRREDCPHWPRGAFDHAWAWGRPSKALPPYEPQLKGRRCRVVCRGKGRGPLNVAVEFPGGELVCAPRWAVRRV